MSKTIDEAVSGHPAAEAELEQLRCRVGMLQDRVGGDGGIMNSKMRYVDITTKGCEGWLNLIIGDYCLAMVKPPVADMVRKALTQQPESELHARIEELKTQLEQDSKEIEVQEHCIIQREKRIAELETKLAKAARQPESEPFVTVKKPPGGGSCFTPEDAVKLSRLQSETPLYTRPQQSAQVPEATEEMLVAGLRAVAPLGELVDWDSTQNECTDRKTIKSIYDAMLAAAPSIAEKPQRGGEQ